ncbi:hypothetical protein [Cellvibrio sp. OA-2007]|uniref:hypothetical protein n=1 Tax=Cellvibrio sp. OA-2007 TaxID=529823 RepID=UPI000785DB65|nr:hypothetical protein [Cellvibrio sp. OA-2007]
MRNVFIKICWPLLRLFETDVQPANYKASHRFALNFIGFVFLLLSFVSALVGHSSGELGAIIPAVIFLGAGLSAVVVGLLGSNGAVAKVWGSK